MEPRPFQKAFPNGALVLHKVAGPTSFGVIQDVKRIVSEAFAIPWRQLPKVGHTGTLDPFAEGLLLVLFGKATKLSDYFLKADKRYEGEILFGHTTPTGDNTVPPSQETTVLPASLEAIQEAALHFTSGPYDQIPPMYSAKKVEGKPLYKLARQGIEIEREPKTCTLSSFEITSWDGLRARFKLHCTSGTYVRTLAQDLAVRMGSLAVLSQLTRTSSGPFDLSDGIRVSDLREKLLKSPSMPELAPAWIPMNDLFRKGMEGVQLSYHEALQVSEGHQNALQRLQPRFTTEKRTMALYHESRLLGVVGRNSYGQWELERVFSLR